MRSFSHLSRPQQAAISLIFSALLFLVDWLSFIHPIGGLNITPWNPPAALEVLFLAWAGPVWMFWVYLTLGTCDVVIRGANLSDPAVFLGNALLVGCYALIASGVKRWLRDRARRSSRDEMLQLSILIMASALLTACLYVGLLTWIGRLPEPSLLQAIYRFFIGDLLGMMVILPLVLMLTDRRRRSQYRGMVVSSSFWWLMIGLGICMVLVFSLPIDQQMKYFFPLFFAVGLIAAAHSLPGATLASALVQLPLVFSALQPGVTPESLLDMQIVMLTLSLTGLMIGTVVDERIQTQDRLRETLQLVAAGELAGSLAHELYQPMSALNAYAESAVLLADTQTADLPGGTHEKLLQTLRRIVQESVRATDIVRGLRSYFISGSSQPQFVDPCELIKDAIGRCEVLAHQRQVLLQFDPSRNAEWVYIDAVQVGTALSNLIRNAIEVSAQGQTVRLSLRTAKSRSLDILVEDEGRAIQTEEDEQMFRPFFSNKPGGLGLGLSISRALVENNGGRLSFQARPSKCFVLTLMTREWTDD